VENIRAAARAGADTFVAGSAIFGSGDYAATIREMRRHIAGAAGAAGGAAALAVRGPPRARRSR
jgi:hypothetical protein